MSDIHFGVRWLDTAFDSNAKLVRMRSVIRNVKRCQATALQKLWCVCTATLFIISSALAQEYDLIIRNGRIADGTGNPAYFADVAIKDGRITRIGRIEEKAASELDAAGLTVAPGFIDVHTHAEDVMEVPLAENFLRMGVTTLVLGNCGSSVMNVGEFFDKLETNRVSINVATLVGHGTVRGKVMGGSFMRPPTSEELGRMKLLVERAMRDGALGISTGLIYLPGTFAKTEELIEVAKAAAAFDGIYVSHMRDEGNDIDHSLGELFRIAREAHIRAEISHIKLSGRNNWGRPSEIVAAIEKARAEGLDVTQDQYAYAASSTGISQIIPDWAREGGKFSERIADPEQKAKIIAEMKSKLARGKRDDFSYAVIAEYRKDRSLNGLNIVQAAKKKHGDDSLDTQIGLIFQIQTNGGASAVFHSMSEDDIRIFMQHPNTMFASDSGMRRYQEGVPHPRGYGNNARFLGRYVRELKLLRLEDAIRKMTSLPATTFHIRDRGIIREGAWADIAIFDPAKVQDNATFDDPHHYATGFHAVLVNGVPVIKDDQHTNARPGKPVRRAGS
jgi:N-acyl-D-amino-acid deacylase